MNSAFLFYSALIRFPTDFMLPNALATQSCLGSLGTLADRWWGGGGGCVVRGSALAAGLFGSREPEEERRGETTRTPGLLS